MRYVNLKILPDALERVRRGQGLMSAKTSRRTTFTDVINSAFSDFNKKIEREIVAQFKERVK